ncbi:GTPase-activating protein RacGAP84C [Scaptodrosophila lebanonensis]|uniref:GTPase-activating protein RacGAP84C n=1 Tax=Drosophila lebanonensis TaxID=7225 RepID=A0A6J2TGU7_DROLE|nr:GTPase-activating protein RacGAP84C [Scaptodrosophila lebanonensis]
MVRDYKSYDELSTHFRLYSMPSMDSMHRRINMNPNGASIDSLDHSGFYGMPISMRATTTLLRQHNFKVKICYNVASCVHCKKRIRFAGASLRCRACPLRCHTDCCHQLTINCIPQPLISSKRGHLSDYAPTVAPRVPALIVHCVTEIETRGLQQEGLYRVSSTKVKCKRLKQKFLRGKETPHLGSIDLHTLCCCIKDFLRELMRPLIPVCQRCDFIAAAQQRDPLEAEEQVYQIMIDMLPAHRDTLAFLMLHWQRVARSPAVKMSIVNIAVIFAPTIFDDFDLNLNNVIVWQQVLRMLLQLPPSFWAQFLVVEPAPLLDEHEEDSGNVTDSNYERDNDKRWRTMKTYFRSMFRRLPIKWPATNGVSHAYQ